MARFVNPFTDFGFKKLFGAGADRNFPFENITFNRKQQKQYEKSLKYYRDLKNVRDTAFADGKKQGRKEGFEIAKEKGEEKERRNIIIKLLKKGKLTPEDIADTLDIPLAIVLQIKQEENL